jgi:hypothetical protein
MAPIYPRSNETVIQSRYNVDFAVNYWLYNGLNKEKLVLGLSLYADNLILLNSTQAHVGMISEGLSYPGKV